MFKILSTYIWWKKYIKCNIWWVVVRPSYMWDARFLKVNYKKETAELSANLSVLSSREPRNSGPKGLTLFLLQTT